jgi:hypothetical protein
VVVVVVVAMYADCGRDGSGVDDRLMCNKSSSSGDGDGQIMQVMRVLQVMQMHALVKSTVLHHVQQCQLSSTTYASVVVPALRHVCPFVIYIGSIFSNAGSRCMQKARGTWWRRCCWQ